MVELFEQDMETNDRQSSKGNQLKWLNGRTWYKADFTGYEGLSEYAVSNLLERSTLPADSYILYQTEEISYHQNKYLGCSSEDFRPKGYQLITLERLFHNVYGESLNKSIYAIKGTEERISFTVNQIVRITGLKDFGKYLSELLTIDAFFLNEDRHTHNIAVLMDAAGKYEYCPIFDNGAALCSDTTMDYPLTMQTEAMLTQVKSKTFCADFDEQLDAVEYLYGQHIRFLFDKKDVECLLKQEKYYPEEIKQRVMQLLLLQMRKYAYLW